MLNNSGISLCLIINKKADTAHPLENYFNDYSEWKISPSNVSPDPRFVLSKYPYSVYVRKISDTTYKTENVITENQIGEGDKMHVGKILQDLRDTINNSSDYIAHLWDSDPFNEGN